MTRTIDERFAVKNESGKYLRRLSRDEVEWERDTENATFYKTATGFSRYLAQRPEMAARCKVTRVCVVYDRKGNILRAEDSSVQSGI